MAIGLLYFLKRINQHNQIVSNDKGCSLNQLKHLKSALLASLLKNYVSTTKAFLLIFLFAITLPLGSLTNLLVEQNIGNIEMYHHFILALVIGIMLHVSTTILYESDESHRFNLPKMVSVLLGFLVAFLGA